MPYCTRLSRRDLPQHPGVDSLVLTSELAGHTQDTLDTTDMAIDTLAEAAIEEQEIMSRVANIDTQNENEKPIENEEIYFDKLQSLIPYLTSKSTTQLDIVLEAITYINILQNKLVQKSWSREWNEQGILWLDTVIDFLYSMYLCNNKLFYQIERKNMV